MASIAQRAAQARRTQDPVKAAELAWGVLADLHGGGGPDGEYGDLHRIRALGTALVALEAGLVRHGRRRAALERRGSTYAAQLEELDRRGVEPYWSEAARRFNVSHTRATQIGKLAEAEARRRLDAQASVGVG